jgi:hypothetical protein
MMGAIMRWRLRIEEAYLGAFVEYSISPPPVYYTFENTGNPLCLVRQHHYRRHHHHLTE